MRYRLAFSLLGLAVATSSSALAGLSLDAQPIFGATAVAPNGWSELAVRIDNTDVQPRRGTIEISSSVSYGDTATFDVHAPFAVGPGSSATVILPLHGLGYGMAQRIEARDDRGQLIAEQNLPWNPRTGQLLVDAIEDSRLFTALHDVSVALSYENGSGSAHRQPLNVALPKWDNATGDPILPLRAAGYATATAVLMASERLVKLTGPELDALTGYTLAGGTLAIVVTRPEDLRHATVQMLVGGEPTAEAPRHDLLLAPVPDAADGPVFGEVPALPAPEYEKGMPPSAEDPPPYVPPSREVTDHFVGHTGGKLQPSAWGASARYGLGEVHLLAFDPTRPPGLDDPWAKARLVDLVRHAWDRRSSIVFAHGSSETTGFVANVHRQLDPNENARWAILFAGLGLLVYAVGAGPLNFSLAAKRGRPLRALLVLPVISAGTFVAILVVGILAKGVHGRARHLSLLEAGAGMERASAKRFRGFFTPRGSELTVRTTDAGSLIRLSSSESGPSSQKLVVDRDGARLVDLTTMPWETVVVREDGFASLGAGLSIVPTEDGDALIVNRIGRDLRGAIAHVPGSSPRYWPRIRDGESVRASSGASIGVRGGPQRAGRILVNGFEPSHAEDVLEGDVPGLASAWKAVNDAASRNVDWFPDDLPVVLAQLDGGEGALTDASLQLESDRALVRVLGWGGTP